MRLQTGSVSEPPQVMRSGTTRGLSTPIRRSHAQVMPIHAYGVRVLWCTGRWPLPEAEPWGI